MCENQELECEDKNVCVYKVQIINTYDNHSRERHTHYSVYPVSASFDDVYANEKLYTGKTGVVVAVEMLSDRAFSFHDLQNGRK